MSDRRGFLTGLFGAAAGVAVAVEGEASTWPLERLLDVYGEEAVGTAVGDLLDLRELRRKLAGSRRREYRARKRRDRRERCRDEILWRGLLGVTTVRSELLALPGDADYDPETRRVRHGGRGRPAVRKARLPWDLEIVSYQSGLSEEYLVPAGTRLVMDVRRDLADICTAELVEVVGREHRLHLWTAAGGTYQESTGRLQRRFGVRLSI